MDVYEDAESDMTIALLELPGVQISDISLTIKDGDLLVQGERSREQTSGPQSSYRVQQLRYGRFRGSITLPPNTEVSSVMSTPFLFPDY